MYIIENTTPLRIVLETHSEHIVIEPKSHKQFEKLSKSVRKAIESMSPRLHLYTEDELKRVAKQNNKLKENPKKESKKDSENSENPKEDKEEKNKPKKVSESKWK